MPSCREIDPLFAPYVDGAATPGERAMVEAHLQACPKCRHATALQAAVRESFREKVCRPCAPAALRDRCRAAARAGNGPFGIPRSTYRALSLAAVLTIVTGGVVVYSLTGVPAVLAAQLAVDHAACFTVHRTDTTLDPAAGEARFAGTYGTPVRLPRRAAANLQLVGLRRCYCGEGAAAHAMYRLDGQPVSLYVIPGASRERASAGAFGHDAIIWSEADATYVLIGRQSREILQPIAAAMEGEL